MARTYSFDFGRDRLRHPHPAIQAEVARKAAELQADIDRFGSEYEYLYEAENCEMCGHFSALSLAIAVGRVGQAGFEPDVVVSECVLKLCGFCSVRLSEAQAVAEVEHASSSWMPGSN